jgi:hypothetical protein
MWCFYPKDVNNLIRVFLKGILFNRQCLNIM